MKTRGFLGLVIPVVFLSLLVVSCGTTQPSPDINATVAAAINDKEAEIRLTIEAEQVDKSTTEAPAPTEEPATAAPLPEPTLPPVNRNRIITYDGWYSGGGLTKLEGIAFENGISLTRFTREQIAQFLEELKKDDVIAALYMPLEVREPDFLELDTFVSNGGSGVFFYDERWSSINDTLKLLFGVSVAEEITISDDGVYYYSQSTLPSYMQGLTVVSSPFAYSYAYLFTNIEGGEKRSLNSYTTDQSRLVYFSTSDRSITFFPCIWGDNSGSFLDDGNIHNQDNAKAALALLFYLLGE